VSDLDVIMVLHSVFETVVRDMKKGRAQTFSGRKHEMRATILLLIGLLVGFTAAVGCAEPEVELVCRSWCFSELQNGISRSQCATFRDKEHFDAEQKCFKSLLCPRGEADVRCDCNPQSSRCGS
jgi:hypothetical protein